MDWCQATEDGQSMHGSLFDLYLHEANKADKKQKFLSNWLCLESKISSMERGPSAQQALADQVA